MSRVVVLKGGRSLEREVSLRSGARVEDALERLGHEVVGLDVGGDLVGRLLALRPEVAFIALHGPEGEDGTVQELLELLAIPYTGPGVSACVRCADKVLAKRLMRGAGLPTPEFHAFSQAAFAHLGAADALPAIEERLEFPIVVKPARQGSSLGIKFAATPAEVPAALVSAFSYDDHVLLERYIDGRDLAVSLVDGEPLPVIEAIPNDENFYDFSARYTIGRTRFECPAELDVEETIRAQALAREVWDAFHCHGFARVDLMRDDATGEMCVLEINAVPGLTDTSLLPLAADAAGMEFEDLVSRILELALESAAAGKP